MKITEGIESTWHYHLSHDDNTEKSLCGRLTMHTSIPLDRWGKTPPNYHIPEKWCAECQRLAALGAAPMKRDRT